MSPDQVIALQDFEFAGRSRHSPPTDEGCVGKYTGRTKRFRLSIFSRRPNGTGRIFYKSQIMPKGWGSRINQVSSGFFETMKIDLLYGRDFSEDSKADTNKIVINEKAAHELGFANAEEALGEWLVYTKVEGYEFQVIGVIKDYSESTKIINGNDLFLSWHGAVCSSWTIRFPY